MNRPPRLSWIGYFFGFFDVVGVTPVVVVAATVDVVAAVEVVVGGRVVGVVGGGALEDVTNAG
jgi:hypothetical protein